MDLRLVQHVTKATIVLNDPLFKLSALVDTLVKESQPNSLNVLLATTARLGLHHQNNVYQVLIAQRDKANVLSALRGMHVHFNQYVQQYVEPELIAEPVRVRTPLVRKALTVYQVQL